MTKMKSLIDQYNWKEIDFPSNKKDWTKVELNHKSVALNILYIFQDSIKICIQVKTWFEARKSRNSLNDYWRWEMALYCSKEAVYIT